MWPHLCRRFIFQSLIWFKSISKFVLGGIRIGMGYMNLVTVIRIFLFTYIVIPNFMTVVIRLGITMYVL